MTWLELVIRALKSLDGEGSYQGHPGIYSHVERIARENGFHLSNEWKATTRQIIESHSSDSKNYRPKNKDVFKHIDRGRWALRAL